MSERACTHTRTPAHTDTHRNTQTHTHTRTHTHTNTSQGKSTGAWISSWRSTWQPLCQQILLACPPHLGQRWFLGVRTARKQHNVITSTMEGYVRFGPHPEDPCHQRLSLLDGKLRPLQCKTDSTMGRRAAPTMSTQPAVSKLAGSGPGNGESRNQELLGCDREAALCRRSPCDVKH